MSLIPGPRRSSALAVIRRGSAAEPTAWERLHFDGDPVGRAVAAASW